MSSHPTATHTGGTVCTPQIVSFHNVPQAQIGFIMSLNYDLTKITVTPTIPFLENGDMNPTTHSLIWCGIVASLSSITEKNVDEWQVRSTVLHGLIQTTKFTRQDIVDNIGMSTNCNNYTRKQWLAHMAKIQKNTLADAVRSVEREIRTHAEAKAVIS
jgi:hypothetical protein